MKFLIKCFLIVVSVFAIYYSAPAHVSQSASQVGEQLRIIVADAAPSILELGRRLLDLGHEIGIELSQWIG